MILYNLPPGFDTSQDLEFGLLEGKRLWNASTMQEWELRV
jgi:hypothetical protein